MRKKHIAGNIRRKMAEWIDTIDDVDIRSLVRENIIVTGGCITSMLLDEKVRDYDVYFADHATTLAVAEYYVNKFCDNPPPRFKGSSEAVNIKVIDDNGRISVQVKSAGAASAGGDVNYEYFESEDRPGEESGEYINRMVGILKDGCESNSDKERGKYAPIFLTQNAITLSHDVQLITRFYGEPEKIHENYDFVHCMNYWTHGEGLVLKQEALECILARELKYVGSLYPICSVFRTRKFINRGWFINAGQYLKMCWQIKDLDLDDVAVLEDQLTGVDTAYFQQLIDIIKKEKEANPELEIDNTYICQLVDRLF